MTEKFILSAREVVHSDVESSGDSSSEESLDSSVSLQLGSSVYDDAWLAPLVGLYGVGADGRKHHWQCSLLLLLVNLLIQGVLLIRIGGAGGLLDEAHGKVNALVHDPGETEVTDGLCKISRKNRSDDESYFRGGVPPVRRGEMTFDCSSIDVGWTSDFDDMDPDGNGNWTSEEAESDTQRTVGDYGYEADVLTIHDNMFMALRKAALAVNGSTRFAADAGALRQAQAVLDQLRNRTITREVFQTQVEPLSGMCRIGDPNLCGNFFLRGALDRTAFLEPLRRRGFEGLPLLFTANDWEGAGEVHTGMIDVCKVATKHICPQLLTARETQYRKVVKEFCGSPSFATHRANVSGVPSTVLTVTYSAYTTYADTVLTKMYMGFLGLILIFWFLSMLEEFNALVTWWRVHCGLLCCSGSSEADVQCTDGAIEVISIPKWYAAWAILTSLAPRTLIFFTLATLGTEFLLSATCFSNLIMDGVALTFLITVDEVMFAAIVPTVRKDWVGMTKPVVPPPQPKVDWVMRHFLNEVFWILVLIAVVGTTLYFQYYGDKRGTETVGDATQCLCQGAGRRCSLARVMGGYPDLPTALRAHAMGT